MQTGRQTDQSNSTSWLLNQWNHSFQYISTVTTDYLKPTINYLKNWNKSENEELYSILPKNRRVWLTDLQDGLEEATRNIIEGKYTLSDFSLHLERLNSLIGPKRISPIQFRQTLINFQKKLWGFDQALSCRKLVEKIQKQFVLLLKSNPEFCEKCLIADANDLGEQWVAGKLTTSALFSELSYYDDKANLQAKLRAIETLYSIGDTSNHSSWGFLKSKLNQFKRDLLAVEELIDNNKNQDEFSLTKETVKSIDFNALKFMPRLVTAASQWVSSHPYLTVVAMLTIYQSQRCSANIAFPANIKKYITEADTPTGFIVRGDYPNRREYLMKLKQIIFAVGDNVKTAEYSSWLAEKLVPVTQIPKTKTKFNENIIIKSLYTSTIKYFSIEKNALDVAKKMPNHTRLIQANLLHAQQSLKLK